MEHKHRRMHDRAVSTIVNKLVHKSYGEGLLFIAESINGAIKTVLMSCRCC